jgi:hypothetical protein
VTLADRNGMRCPRAAARHCHSRAAWASVSRHYDRGARCSLDWDRRRRVTPVQTTSPEAWPEADLRDDDSLWREPRWNADGRAPLAKGASRTARRGGYGSAFFGVPLSFFFLRLHSWLEVRVVRLPVTTAGIL